MKKILVIFLALIMLLCLCACNQSATLGNGSTTQENPAPQPTTCDHEWMAATCTAPKTCSKCNETKGGLGHVWKIATCTARRTCMYCGVRDGEALGHNFGPDGSFYCVICGYLTREGYPITIRFHYKRPDGDYEGWNLWVWDNDAMPATELDPPYAFEVIDDEAICTIKVRTDTQELGYIVRYGDWICKDIDDDQFIDLSDISIGTIDFYIQSGEKGGELVLS